MKKQYFGFLPHSLYKKNEINEIIEYLSKENICEIFIVKGNTQKIEKTRYLGELRTEVQTYHKGKNVIYFKDLVYEFYEFLLNHYAAGLGNHIAFNMEFHQETFGLEFNESKKIALGYFNLFYKQLPINESFKYKFDTNRKIVPALRFETLERYKENILLNLQNKSKLIIPYLAGDDKFYDRELFENNSMIKEIFDFENNLKILIELNKKYKFEEDSIFIPKSISQTILKKYENEFYSLKQIEFIEHQIKLKEKIIRADIVGLFDFFSNHLKITTPSGKVFGEIINNYFNFNFSKIKLNSSESTKHYNNISKLKKDWENFKN